MPSRQRCFITVTRARAKGQLREQSVHLVSPLFGSCGAGEGQSEAEGISKPVCLLDLCVTLCSLSVKSPSLSPTSLYPGLFSDLTVLALLIPPPFFSVSVYFPPTSPSLSFLAFPSSLCVFLIHHSLDTSHFLFTHSGTVS